MAIVNDSSKHLEDHETHIFCRRHNDEKYTFVCQTCSELICNDCVDEEDHSLHDFKSIKKFIKETNIDELKGHFNVIKKKTKVLNEIEKQFQHIVESINIQASNLISEISQIKEKTIQECERKKSKNIDTVQSVISVIDPLSILDNINKLPKTGGHKLYAEVAESILKYYQVIQSEEFESKCKSSLFLPTFAPEKIQTSRLEKQFGNLSFDEEGVGDLFENIEETDESESSDDKEPEDDRSNNEAEAVDCSDFIDS